MKKIHNVLAEVTPHVLASFTASAIALVVFWWLMKYSILSLPDMIGAMVVIYFIVLWRMAIWLERRKRRRRK